MEIISEDASRKLALSYQLLFERNPLPMWVYDVQTLRMLAVNEAALVQYGYNKQEFVGLNLLDLHPVEDVAQVQAQLKLPLHEQPVQNIWRHIQGNGELIEVEMLAQDLEFDGVHARMVRVKDMTAQRRAEQGQHQLAQHLIEERETLAAVVNTTTNGVISIDDEGHIQLFNPGAERIFGRTAASMAGQTVALLMPARFRQAHPQHQTQFAHSRESSRMMGLSLVKGERADGQELDLEVTISQVTVQHRQVMIAIVKDVTLRVRSEAQYRQSRAQLTELTQRLMTQEKTLVKRLAQVLHDQLGQTMAAIRMSHETILMLQSQAPSDVARMQGQMGKHISLAIQQVRQVLVDLRPPLLEEHGLAAALDNELRNRSLTQPHLDISINIAPEVTLARWPSEVEYAAFMVAREAIENALRHSGASVVAVHLSGSTQALQLAVIDSGIGMAAHDIVKPGHLGILGMQERADAVGAIVTLDTQGAPDTPDASGTCVQFFWTAANSVLVS